MSSNEPVNVSRAEAAGPAATLKANLEAEFAAALDKATTTLELTQTGVGDPRARWEVWARGPYQAPGLEPGRIIMKGETAYIAVVLWMNPAMCRQVLGYGGKFELEFFTSNTQTMHAVPGLHHHCCIFPVRGRCWYIVVWEFTPTEEACLLETNICVRHCNCGNGLVPDYAGFVRWVHDFDRDRLFPRVRWEFDHPIRYMVADRDRPCECDPTKNPC